MLKRSRHLISIALVALFAGMGIAVLPTVAQAKPTKNCAPGPGLDLSGCSYVNADLMGDNFSGSDLSRANLSGADLNETNFTNADLRHANLSGAGMVTDCSPPTSVSCPVAPGSNIFLTTYEVNPNFTNADLHDADLSSVRLGGQYIQVGSLCVPHLGCAPEYVFYPDSILTGVKSGGITGMPASLPSGWKVVDGYLTVPPPALQITSPSSLPAANHDVPYSAELSATGGNPPYRWMVISGSLPTGLHLHRASGMLSGTPRSPGTSIFTIEVVDTKTRRPTTQRMQTMVFTLQVN